MIELIKKLRRKKKYHSDPTELYTFNTYFKHIIHLRV